LKFAAHIAAIFNLAAARPISTALPPAATTDEFGTPALSQGQKRTERNRMPAAHMFGLPLEELLPALYSAGTVWVLLRTGVLVRLSGSGGGGGGRAERSPE
jgi:hypothetical protein